MVGMVRCENQAAQPKLAACRRVVREHGHLPHVDRAGVLLLDDVNGPADLGLQFRSRGESDGGVLRGRARGGTGHAMRT
eukprot:11829218-Alexandrium_andersonii.AAC.1